MVLSFLVGTLCCWLQSEIELLLQKKKRSMPLSAGLCFKEEFISIFIWKYREHYPIFQEIKPEATSGKAEWTEWEDNKVHGKTFKNHTGFRSGLTHYCDQRRNPVWLSTYNTPKYFHNSQSTILDGWDGDKWEIPRKQGTAACRAPQTRGRWILWSCLVFIY